MRARCAGGRARDLLADAGGAGEGDEVDARVLGQRLAGLRAPAGHDVQDARREASLLEAARELEGVTGVWSEGLTTSVQPAASAGASFQTSSSSGEFHGTIAPTTPTGSCTRVDEEVGLVGRDRRRRASLSATPAK